MSSTKRKAPPLRIARPQMTQNAKHASRARINDSRMAVVNVPKHQQKSKKKAAGEAIEISSDEESDNSAVDEDDLMDEDEPATAAAASAEPKTNGHVHANATANVNGSSKNDEENDDNEDEDGDHEPTFGDLVREHETVDVAAALSLLNPADAAAAAAPNGKNPAAAPTLASLGHLLNSALRSGDDANLEICFSTTTDTTWIRNTIQRLDPSLAGTLLQKLAARIHRRPGRAHTLVGWVQWTLITHGGALLANQAGVTRALQELHRVLEERARGLNSLLLLKGKLDMLEAQMQMRRQQRAGGVSSSSIITTSGPAAGAAAVSGRIGSKAVDSITKNMGRTSGGARGSGRRRRALGADAADEENGVATYIEDFDDNEDEAEADISGQVLVNNAGVAGESFIADSDEEALDEDDDDDSEDDGEEGGVVDDDDLEEVDDDEAGEEDEVDFDDVDDDDDEDDDDDGEEEQATAPPPKLQKKSGGAFSKRR
ncbi:Small subunit (SSU) processome component [Sporothrix curviconia]|uniref:Small subunit (SSU) processome component n=1 Tax=Sporothrix curviconia TaxID=1260050 RepID=A0ABP0CWG2_9PEZI